MKALRVYLVRHGKATEQGLGPDEDRSLTDEGRERMRRTAEAFAAAAKPAPARWITSPLVRAVQTCEICVSAFGHYGPVEISRLLLPESRVGAAAALLGGREAAVVLVGHDPLFSTLAANLLGLPTLGVAFKKGAVIAIDLPRGGGVGKLAFHLRPAGADRDPELRDVLAP